MLKRLRVQGFKSLLDVELEMAPLVVLFGPNTAGKSNVLEALLVLSRLVNGRGLADALEEPFRGLPQEAFSFPDGGLQELMDQNSASFSIEADIQPALRDKERRADPLRYRVEVRTKPATGSMALGDEFLSRLDSQGNPKEAAKIELDGEVLKVRQIGRPGHPATWETGITHTLASYAPYTGVKYPDFERLRKELAAWKVYYLDPRDLMRSQQSPREVKDIGSQGTWIAPLLYGWKVTASQERYFRAVGRALRSAIPSISSLDVDLDRKRGTLDIQICQDGTPYSSRVISEGTLRVLALCAIAANPSPGTLVAFEEPENGVHPSRLDVVADLLFHMVTDRRRQVVVTTHSPAFVASMARRQKEAPEDILLLRCFREGRATGVAPFQPRGELFQDREIRDALQGDEKERLLEEMLRRGWLDGR